MRIPETIIVEEVLPEARRKAAMELHARKWHQSRISSVLGTSQSMISRYLTEDHDPKPSLQRMVDTVAGEIVAGALSGEDLEALSVRFCSITRTCMRMGLLKERFEERFGSRAHPFVFGEDPSHGTRFDVLNDLERSLELLKGKDLRRMVPALKINMAQAIEDAGTVEDVASFPGRLIDRNGVIIGARPPEFGASSHLAGILLEAMEKDRSVRAAGSVVFSKEIRQVIEEGKLRIIDRSAERGGLPIDEGSRYVADPGDFGVEPCLYVFGISAMEVAIRILDIGESLVEGRVSNENQP
jgi:predicted fused transcriptional regulator/phosphomethylpyrimidine kinase/predicted transcriptional regulator